MNLPIGRPTSATPKPSFLCAPAFSPCCLVCVVLVVAGCVSVVCQRWWFSLKSNNCVKFAALEDSVGRMGSWLSAILAKGICSRSFQSHWALGLRVMNNDGSCEWGFDTSADEVGKISVFLVGTVAICWGQACCQPIGPGTDLIAWFSGTLGLR